MADRYIIRVEVLVVGDNNVVDPNPLYGRTTEFALGSLEETVLICAEMRDLANDAMNETENQDTVTPFVNVREVNQ